MFQSLGTLWVRLGANTRGIEKAHDSIKRFARSASAGFKKVTEASNRAERSFGRTSRAAGLLRGALVGAFSVEIIRRTVLMADRFAILLQRIKNATLLMGDFKTAAKELLEVSARTGTPIFSSVRLFQDMQRAAPNLKTNTKEILQTVEAIGQMGVIGGSTAEQMRFGILQLSQGLAAGIFRTEELNSLLENTPEIIIRIGEGLGKGAAELRQQVLAGKVLSKDVYQSMLKQVGDINKQFEFLPPAIQRSLVTFSNSWQQFMNQWDQAFNITPGSAGFMNSIAVWLRGDFSGAIQEVRELIWNIAAGIEMWAHSFMHFVPEWYTWEHSLSGVTKFFNLVVEGLQMLPINFVYFANWAGNRLRAINETVMQGIRRAWQTMKELAHKANPLKDKQRGTELYAQRVAMELKHTQRMTELGEELAGLQELYQVEMKLLEELKKGQEIEHRLTMQDIADREKALREYAQQRQKQIEEWKKQFADLQKQDDAATSFKKQQEDFQPKLDQLAHSLQTEIETENRAYLEKQLLLENARLLKLETIMSYDELEIRLLEDHQKRIDEITQKHEKKRSEISKFFGEFGIKLEKKVGGETLETRGKNFVDQINQAGQHSKKFFALKKALALATALIEGPKAVLSAYTFGNELGGPILGAIFGGIAAAATAVQIQAIASSRFSGGRAMGGDVSAGQMYRVAENGPEMLSSGGKSYLMMGKKGGYVTPSGGMGGGGSKVIVNIHPPSGHEARAEQNSSKDQEELDIFFERIDEATAVGITHGTSRTSEAIQQAFGANRAAGSIG